MAIIRRNKLLVLLLAVFIVSFILTIVVYNIIYEEMNKEFIVLDKYKFLYDINTASIYLRKNLISHGTVICGNTSLTTIGFNNVLLYINCSYLHLTLNNKNRSIGHGTTYITIPYLINGTTTNYYRIFYGRIELNTALPQSVTQGLIEVFENDDEKYYVIASIPYIYFKLEYGKGLGNASFIFKLTLSINDRNLTYPYIIEYYANSNSAIILSPVETPFAERVIRGDKDKLSPLLEIRGGRKVNITWYIEVYANYNGIFDVDIIVGYPALRVATSS